MFKKIRYGEEPLLKIKAIDETGAYLEDWTIRMSELGAWVRKMGKKYGIDLDKGKEDKDLDWVK